MSREYRFVKLWAFAIFSCALARTWNQNYWSIANCAIILFCFHGVSIYGFIYWRFAIAFCNAEYAHSFDRVILASFSRLNSSADCFALARICFAFIVASLICFSKMSCDSDKLIIGKQSARIMASNSYRCEIAFSIMSNSCCFVFMCVLLVKITIKTWVVVVGESAQAQKLIFDFH